MAKKKILITGSSGYVGQHLIAALAFGGISNSNDRISATQQQYELYCAYNVLTTFEADLNQLLSSSTLHPSITGVYPIPNIDFSRAAGYISEILKAVDDGGEPIKIDAIIHLAALSSPGYCEKNESVAWQVNCPVDLLTLNAPIIYMSTDQVYEGTKQYYKEDTDETVPVNVYGRTKLAFEKVLLNESSTNDKQSQLSDTQNGSVILRSSLILGPATPLSNGCKKGAFPSFLQFIESRLRSSTKTDYFVNEFRSVVYIEDVIRAIKHFLQHALTNDKAELSKTRVFNLGGSTRASRIDIALEVASVLKLDAANANGVNRPIDGGGVPSPPDISMNVDKITNELAVSKMMGLNDIVKGTFK